VQERFGLIKISGGHFPLGAWRSSAASVAATSSWLLLGYSFAGKALLDNVGIAEPAFLGSAREAKYPLLMAFVAMNVIGNKLTATGAYEISLNVGEKSITLWSKLESGVAPSLDALFAACERAGLAPAKVIF